MIQIIIDYYGHLFPEHHGEILEKMDAALAKGAWRALEFAGERANVEEELARFDSSL